MSLAVPFWLRRQRWLTQAGGITAGVGLATETDTALGLAVVKLAATGRADETDSALGLTAARVYGAGRSDETDTALALAAVKLAATGRADETDTALTLGAVKLTTTGRADETDSALGLTAARVYGAGRSDETDTAFALAAVKLAATGRADETDTALALALASGLTVGRADETDSAFGLAVVKVREVGRSDETDTATAAAHLKRRSTGLASESDAGLALAKKKIRVYGLALEIDEALALGSSGGAPDDGVSGVRLRPFFPANEPTGVPTPGTGGFYPLVATAEPLSAGAPPLLPSLVSRIEFQLASRVVEDGAGYALSHAMAKIHRPTLRVRWGHVTHDERDDLVEFLTVTCGDGRLAFDVEPDGPGTGVVKVRAIAAPEYSWVGRPAHVVEVEVEQVF